MINIDIPLSTFRKHHLAAAEGAFVKRALICYEGFFEGINGEVDVTPKMLEGICERYKSEKANPKNDYDFAPILVDHIRLTKNVMGRVLAEGMKIGPWTNPEGEECVGLFGNLRIDDPDAQENVKSGKFSSISMSFDEDTFELYEVSFVAVPAAKGSILLSKGGQTMNYQKKLSLVTKKHNALAAAARGGLNKRKVILARMISSKTLLSKEATALAKSIELMGETIKAGQLKARFQSFVNQGKMTPAELKELDVKSLCQLAAPAVDAIIKAYAGRAPSDDVTTYGQTSEEMALTGDMSPKAMRAAMELQKSGKKATSLAAGDKPAGELSEEDKEKAKLAADAEKSKSISMSAEDYKQCMEHMDNAHKSLKACLEKIGGLNGDAEKLAEADKDEEKKLEGEDGEEGLEASEDDEKLAAEEEEKAKLAKEEEDKKAKLAADEKEKEKLAAAEKAKAEKEGAK
jgi:hypothetical protein